MTITDRLRIVFGRIIEQVATFLVRAGMQANQITVIGFIGNAIAAVFIGFGYLFIGGVIAAFSCILDGLDGAVAKASGGGTHYGSLLDSTLDRFSEIALFLGLLIYYDKSSSGLGILFVFLALIGSVMVSYVRAKGEALGVLIKRGLMTRVERLVVLIVSLLFRMPLVGLVIIAIIGNITAVQRFWIARTMLIGKDKTKND
jgi:CDP-diacylglycerol--glycerol-3-phosphate 3-phosphatidyltransferase